MSKRSGRIVPTLLAAAVLLALTTAAAAQEVNPPTPADASAGTSDTTPTKAKNLDAVVVTGTRASNRTVSSSLTPIDVISAETLKQTGTIDLTQALARTIPSLNFPFAPASDTFAFQRPFQLRGLSPDQVLVLVNGKRWHSGALLLSLGQIGQGSQGIDLNTIPMSAIDHVEVLRDGASAQYGSDALAGVINIILKKGAQFGDVQVTGGQYSAGDGRAMAGLGQLRFPARRRQGLDALRRWRKATRVRPTAPAWTAVPASPIWARNSSYGVVSFKNQNLFLNTEYDITPGVQFYAFGHYGRRVGEPRGFFRYGTNTPSPNNPLIGLVYPDGFLPKEHGVSIDRSLVAGLRGSIERLELGRQRQLRRQPGFLQHPQLHQLSRMLNDFGSSPTDFHDGTLTATQQTFDIDISKEIGARAGCPIR